MEFCPSRAVPHLRAASRIDIQLLTSVITVPASLHISNTIRGTKEPLSVGLTEANWFTRTPMGLGSLTLERLSTTTVRAVAWGDGAEWILNQAPRLLGSDDDLEGFQPEGRIGELWRRNPFFLGRTDRPWDSIVSWVLGQKVQVQNAKRSRHLLAKTFGDPIPGPMEGWILPSPETVAELGYYQLHPFGIERKRAQTLIRVANEMSRLSDLMERTPAQVQARLQRVRGIGPWTAAMVTASSMGDADAVPLGDYHIPNTVAWALAGEERASDQRMLELLEPYTGHRWRVIRLAKGLGEAPKHGPRLDLRGDGLHLGH